MKCPECNIKMKADIRDGDLCQYCGKQFCYRHLLNHEKQCRIEHGWQDNKSNEADGKKQATMDVDLDSLHPSTKKLLTD